MEPIAGVDGESAVRRLRGDHEALFLAGLPIVFQVTMPARAFVAEIPGIDAFALRDERHAIFVGHFAAAHGFVTAVPHAENNAALGPAVDLHPEIAAMPAARHVVSGDRIFESRDLTVECGDVRAVWKWIPEMHRRGVAAR